MLPVPTLRGFRLKGGRTRSRGIRLQLLHICTEQTSVRVPHRLAAPYVNDIYCLLGRAV